MKETYNWKSLFAAAVIIIAGVILCLISPGTEGAWNTVWLSIGCSLIASGIVIMMHDFFVERKTISPLDEWNVERIAETRAEINKDCDEAMEHAKKRVDIVAFGLSSFRTAQTEVKILNHLKNGVEFRILTMDPDSVYVTAREKEENENKNIKHSIEALIKWADEINSKSKKGKITIKGYSSMTLDFYWRVDDVIYVGPYWYGYDSQQMITYKFKKKGKGFDIYAGYFEKLWTNKDLSKTLTMNTSRKSKK